jgi:hypothetical protein
MVVGHELTVCLLEYDVVVPKQLHCVLECCIVRAHPLRQPYRKVVIHPFKLCFEVRDFLLVLVSKCDHTRLKQAYLPSFLSELTRLLLSRQAPLQLHPLHLLVFLHRLSDQRPHLVLRIHTAYWVGRAPDGNSRDESSEGGRCEIRGAARSATRHDTNGLGCVDLPVGNRPCPPGSGSRSQDSPAMSPLTSMAPWSSSEHQLGQLHLFLEMGSCLSRLSPPPIAAGATPSCVHPAQSWVVG